MHEGKYFSRSPCISIPIFGSIFKRMKLIRFIKSRTFLVNLIVMLIIAVGGIFAVQWWLSGITDHGEVVVVPDLTGMTVSMVEEDLQELTLDYEVLDSSEFSTEYEPGSVVGQYPSAGSAVKADRVIKLTLNPMHERKLELPAIEDIPRIDAQYRLESRGFKVGDVRYVPDIAKDNVLWVELNGEKVESGEMYEKGTAFNLVLGMGLSDEKTYVPKLYGMALDSARTRLGASMLNIGAVLYDEEISDTTSAVIYKQTPAPTPEFVIRMGSGVDVWLTNDGTKVPIDSLSMRVNPDTTIVL